MYLKAKWTRSSRKNNFTSPAAIRQPTAQTTWPFFLPVPPPGVTTQGHCAVWGGGHLGSPAKDEYGDRADSVFPCSGSVHVLILKLSPRENTSLFKFFKTTTNLHFTPVFYFDKKSLSQAEVYRGKYRKFVTWFARIFSEVSPGTPPTLVRSWDKREKPTGLRTNENKGSGLWPVSNSALMRLVWAEGRVPRQPGVLPVTQFQDQGRDAIHSGLPSCGDLLNQGPLFNNWGFFFLPLAWKRSHKDELRTESNNRMTHTKLRINYIWTSIHTKIMHCVPILMLISPRKF